MMAAMRHPNVVLYLGVCLDPPCVVTEYCARGSLNDVLKRALYNAKCAAALSPHTGKVQWAGAALEQDLPASYHQEGSRLEQTRLPTTQMCLIASGQQLQAMMLRASWTIPHHGHSCTL